MVVYTIYLRPADFPDAVFVVRGAEVGPGFVVTKDVLGTADTLDEARDLVPRSHDYCIPRQDHEDPVIVETWI
jgi:hypothetical protein